MKPEPKAVAEFRARSSCKATREIKKLYRMPKIALCEIILQLEQIIKETVPATAVTTSLALLATFPF